jgi:FtsH-binding integral membrane protein
MRVVPFLTATLRLVITGLLWVLFSWTTTEQPAERPFLWIMAFAAFVIAIYPSARRILRTCKPIDL